MSGGSKPLAAPAEVDQIVVTGSRIARDPNIGSAAPILAATAEKLELSGTGDLVDTLRDNPALSTSTSVEGSIDGVFSEAVGQSILNLRGLGSNRRLVLVNGRRHVSGVAGEQAVDINSIPTAPPTPRGASSSASRPYRCPRSAT